MEAYLLDTSALSPLVDAVHPKHKVADALIASLGAAPIYVSVIALAEMQYGFRLYERFTGKALPKADTIISAAEGMPRLDISHHTAAAYAELKSALALYYLKKNTKDFRKPHVEDWIDQFTGKALGVDDNDLWVCAQARETNYVVVADDRMAKIRQADPALKILLIP